MRPPPLLAVSDRHQLAAGALSSWAVALAAAALPGLLLREKDLGDRALWALASHLRRLLPSPTLLLVSGRPDVAVGAGADGVHLPADGVPVAVARALLPELLVGRSTHRLQEVERAAEEGADYVLFGPVYDTPGKGPALGLDALAEAAGVGIPVLAVGGVTAARLAEVAATGAAGVAAIRWVLDSRQVAPAVAAVRRVFGRPPDPRGGAR